MQEKKPFVIGLAAILALAIACGGHQTVPSSSSSSPIALTGPSSIDVTAGGTSGGSRAGRSTVAERDAVPGAAADDDVTLKASAPTPQSPLNDERLPEVKTAEEIVNVKPTLVTGAARGTYVTAAFQYRFRVLGPTGGVIEEVLQSGTSFTMTKTLEFNTRYTWIVRAELDGAAGPWSTNGSFVTPVRPIPPPPPPPPPPVRPPAYILGAEVSDPLTTGQSVGKVSGGTFLPGRGWQAQTLDDAINYDIPTTTAATFEFDITGVESDEPGPYDIGMKFYCMGDSSLWDFNGFRNQPFKASLDKKSGRIYKGESGVVEHIFRTVDDDNRTKTGERAWHDTQVYHVSLTWGNGRVLSKIDNEVIADETYSIPYAPRNHRISLGCTPRRETLKGAIWSNVKVTPK